MDSISLQCSELLFRDGFADDEAAEVIILHLVATGGAGCAGLGKIALSLHKPFRRWYFGLQISNEGD
jgi:hypothetical protein